MNHKAPAPPEQGLYSCRLFIGLSLSVEGDIGVSRERFSDSATRLVRRHTVARTVPALHRAYPLSPRYSVVIYGITRVMSTTAAPKRASGANGPPLRHLLHPRFHGAPFQHTAIPDPVSTLMPQLAKRHYGYFWGALVTGFAGLVGLTEITVAVHTGTVEEIFIVAGSLFVPILFVYYMDMRSLFVPPRFRTLLATFLLGAIVAAPVAAVLESFLPAGTGTFGPSFVTGLIEEFCKAGILFWLMFKQHRFLRFEMDGIILGAAAGMGFAAVEDMIYGASAFHSGLHSVVLTVWLRQMLGPFGHGVWTAIVGGAIWRAKKNGRVRITIGVVGGYLTAAILHAFWDWAPLPGLADLLWLLGVGVVGILILRALIHEALGQEKETIAGVGLQIGTAPATPT